MRVLRVALAVVAFTAAATGTVAVAKPPEPTKPPKATYADTVLRNGFVYTVDSKRSVKQTVALKDGVILYVGNEGAVKRFIGPDTEVVDLRGRMVMPGLQDGHMHAFGGGKPTSVAT